MKVKNILEGILNYYSATRQVGHTTAMINGVNNTPNVMFVTSNKRMSDLVSREFPNVTCKTLSDFECNHLRGYPNPIAFDNHALWEIFKKSLERIEVLETELYDLKFKPWYGQHKHQH